MIDVKTEKISEFNLSQKNLFGGNAIVFGSRIVSIKNDKGSIITPERGININDINSTSEIPELTSIVDFSHIFLYENNFTFKHSMEYLKDNYLPKNLHERVDKYFKRAQNFYLKLFYPKITDKSLVNSYNNYDKTLNFIRLMETISVNLKLELFIIPNIIPLEFNAEPNLNYIDKIISTSNEKMQFGITIDIRYRYSDVFRKMLDKILSYDSSVIPIVFIRHAEETQSFSLNNYLTFPGPN